MIRILSLPRNARRCLCRIALSAAMLAPLAACRAPPPRIAAPDRVPPPAAAQDPADPSYDWHGLLIAPFGSVLKDIPAALHEVLLFRDDTLANAAAGSAATGSAAADPAADAECYASDAPAPRFVGRIPEEYLLCFRHERLSRILASVRVDAARAADIFAAACAAWLKNAAPTTGEQTPAAAPGLGTPGAEAQNTGACEGRDGAVHFRGRLEEEPGGADLPQPERVLSVTLDSAADP